MSAPRRSRRATRDALRRALDHHEDASGYARTAHLYLEELVVAGLVRSDDPNVVWAHGTLRDAQREILRARAIVESLVVSTETSLRRAP
jgi:hypothetical protein